MSFDIHTLLVAVALASAFCAGARFLLWRMHPGIPGLFHWVLASCSAVLAIALILFYEANPWPPLLSLAQLFVAAGLILSWNGMRRFIGRQPVSRAAMIAFTVIVLAWITAKQFQHLPEARALGNALLVTVFSGLIARELIASSTPAMLAMRATGWVFAANATVFLMRIIFAAPNPQNSSLLDPDGFAAFMLFWWLCTTIAVTLGMILMTAERLQADLNSQANRDPLTGALNRRSFTLFTEKAVAQARRYNKPLSVMIMDLDDFKQINDGHGHEVGDQLLCRFVAVADQMLRIDDIFCRYGGEEFVALLPNTSAKQAMVAAERLRIAFAVATTAVDTSDDVPPVTVSIGVADLNENEDFDSLLRRADTALYQAKDSGRNRCQLDESIGKKTRMSKPAKMA